MYGIPNMKLDKGVVQRRLDLLGKEGVEFRTGVNVGIDISAEEIEDRYDATVICVGATKPRDLKIPGRSLNGIHFAMDFLRGSTSYLLSQHGEPINTAGKDVVVIGGGDTGTDCIGCLLYTSPSPGDRG